MAKKANTQIARMLKDLDIIGQTLEALDYSDESLEAIDKLEDNFLDVHGHRLNIWIDSGGYRFINSLLGQVTSSEAFSSLVDTLSVISDAMSFTAILDGADQVLHAQLFAIPIVGILPSDEGFSDPVLDKVTKSIRQFGWVGSGPTVSVLPVLFRYDQLQQHWCDRKRVLKKYINVLFGKTDIYSVLQDRMFDIDDEVDSVSEGALRLRYAVGLIVNDHPVSLELEDTQFEKWEMHLNQLLSEFYQAPVAVQSPELYDVAIRSGLTHFNFESLAVLLGELNEQHDGLDGCFLKLLVLDNYLGVHISISNAANETIGNFTWHLAEGDDSHQIDLESDLILELAKEHGLKIATEQAVVH
jgi:hypothetical protein